MVLASVRLQSSEYEGHYDNDNFSCLGNEKAKTKRSEATTHSVAEDKQSKIYNLLILYNVH